MDLKNRYAHQLARLGELHLKQREIDEDVEAQEAAVLATRELLLAEQMEQDRQEREAKAAAEARAKSPPPAPEPKAPRRRRK